MSAPGTIADALRAEATRRGFARDVVDAGVAALDACAPAWQARDAAAFGISLKVGAAFADAGLTEAHLAGTTGYGYHDIGREAYERVLAACLDAEAAFVRTQFVSGTHALVAAIEALAPAGSAVLSLTGRPYDTLRMALADHPRAMTSRGVAYREAENEPSAVREALAAAPAVAFVQRSRGYAPRPALPVVRIGELVDAVRELSPQTIVVVDNCYGEFVEALEPCAVGADLVVGSLIKNPGGGIAPGGAYVAGKAELLERIAHHVFAPGLGLSVGPTLHVLPSLFNGLYRAPKAVAECLKSLDFAAALFAALGYQVEPACGAARTDIVQAIRLSSPDALLRFAAGMQRCLPIDALATPVPGAVPGYADPVVMATGAFVSGATLDLSCDAPMREPFECYVQGGVDVAYGVIALVSAAAALRAR